MSAVNLTLGDDGILGWDDDRRSTVGLLRGGSRFDRDQGRRDG